jgi:STELLO glycosyltransferases
VSQPLIAVVTTIQAPTDCVRAMAERVRGLGGTALVVGDEQGPARYDVPATELISFRDQLHLPFSLAPLLPARRYARKNLGYLVAASRGAACIYETDDDNAPAATWTPRAMETTARRVPSREWVNVYRLFADRLIWPRGFPLELISDQAPSRPDPDLPLEEVRAPIQQGLSDGSPDVDALWRLLMDGSFTFQAGPSVWLPPGTWCPFNSQSTWWWPPAYPLMYLPSHCTFRTTDIWRSFVAQRCLWELGAGVVFHASEVVQERNPHDLMKDFAEEVPGYLGNLRLARTLADLRLTPGPDAAPGNVVRCYEALVAAGFLPEDELPLVNAWLADLEGALDVNPVRA